MGIFDTIIRFTRDLGRFFKSRYKRISRKEFILIYNLLIISVLSVIFIIIILDIKTYDPLTKTAAKYKLVFSTIFILISTHALHVSFSKPKLNSLHSLEIALGSIGNTYQLGTIDFKRIGYLYQREELKDIENKIDLTFKSKNRIVLIHGEPASGKSALALIYGLKLWKNKYHNQVFYWNLSTNKGVVSDKNPIESLQTEIEKNHREIILIIEDIHQNIELLENTITPLILSQKKLIVILTSRHIGEYHIDELPKYEFQQNLKKQFYKKELKYLGSEISLEIKTNETLVRGILKSHNLEGYLFNFDLIKSGNEYNLILLDAIINILSSLDIKAESLKYPDIKIEKIYDYIFSHIEKSIKEFEKNGLDKQCFLNTLFLISTFSKYEFPIEETFLVSELNNNNDIGKILSFLVNKCEIYIAKFEKKTGYLISHQKYSELINETLKKYFSINLDEDSILTNYIVKGLYFGKLSWLLVNSSKTPRYVYLTEGRRRPYQIRTSDSEIYNSSKLAHILKDNCIKLIEKDFISSIISENSLFINSIKPIKSDFLEKMKNNKNIKYEILTTNLKEELLNEKISNVSYFFKNLKDIFSNDNGHSFLDNNQVDIGEILQRKMSENSFESFLGLVSILDEISKEYTFSFIKKNAEFLEKQFKPESLTSFDSTGVYIYCLRLSQELRDFFFDKILKKDLISLKNSTLERLYHFFMRVEWVMNNIQNELPYIFNKIDFNVDDMKKKISTSSNEEFSIFLFVIINHLKSIAEDFFNKFKNEIFNKFKTLNLKEFIQVINNFLTAEDLSFFLYEYIQNSYSENLLCTFQKAEKNDILGFLSSLYYVSREIEFQKLYKKIYPDLKIIFPNIDIELPEQKLHDSKERLKSTLLKLKAK